MTIPRFIQIHALHSYTGVLLNRDDSGLAKRIPVGGHIRTRISSQCLKRHWRVAGGPGMGLSELGETSVRTRLVERRIEPLVAEIAPEMKADLRDAAIKQIVLMLYGAKNYEVKKRQAVLLGETELSYLSKLVVELVGDFKTPKEVEDNAKERLKDTRANFAAMTEACGIAGGIPGALFGRMVTADPASNLDAAVSVAHSFTVHTQESEGDALTVVDDLVTRALDGSGSGGMFDTEINSGTFYSYVVVDVPQLVANVTGRKQEEYASTDVDRELAASIVERLIKLIATVSPGAKTGSTAPYGYAESMMVEIGDAQPRSLATAFHVPVPLRQNRAVSWIAADRIQERLVALDQTYGNPTERMYISVSEEAELGGANAKSLDNLAAFAGNAVRGEAMKMAAE